MPESVKNTNTNGAVQPGDGKINSTPTNTSVTKVHHNIDFLDSVETILDTDKSEITVSRLLLRMDIKSEEIGNQLKVLYKLKKTSLRDSLIRENEIMNIAIIVRHSLIESEYLPKPSITVNCYYCKTLYKVPSDGKPHICPKCKNYN